MNRGVERNLLLLSIIIFGSNMVAILVIWVVSSFVEWLSNLFVYLLSVDYVFFRLL